MKLLSSEVKNLLDKLYNLRGEDSVILRKMTKEREDALSTQERTKNEKAVLLQEIEKLTNEEKTLAEEGNRLMNVLQSINRNDFANVLDRLNIDFDPEQINAKITKLLPDTINKVVKANEEATKRLENVESEMNNAITLVEELGIRKDEAISNQVKLNEFFELALSGNINITRDEITSLLDKFDFNEDEQREAAKILMFPEDALYEYDASFRSGNSKFGRSIGDVIVEAKKESENKVEEPKETEINEVKQSAEQPNELENIFDQVIESNVDLNEIKPTTEEPNKKELLDKLLEECDINKNIFSENNYAKLLENYKDDVLKTNVESLKNNKIDMNIIANNVELLYDSELKDKIEKLIAIGKESRDISLMPSVLIKYDLEGLNKTINILQVSGLDPKKVPLMAY